jgi:hypothetical protein
LLNSERDTKLIRVSICKSSHLRVYGMSQLCMPSISDHISLFLPCSMDLEDAAHPTEPIQRRQSHQRLKEILFGGDSQLDRITMGDPSKWSPQKLRQLIMMQHPLKPSRWSSWREIGILLPVIAAAVVVSGTWAILCFLVFAGSTIGQVTAVPSSATFTTTLAPTVAPEENVPLVAPTTEALNDGVSIMVSAVPTAPIGDNHMNKAVDNRNNQEPTSQSEPQRQGPVASIALSRANQAERWKDLVGLISRKNVTPIEDFADPTSSAFKALDWMIEYDQEPDMAVISSDTAMHILETYALAVFFFATHPSLPTSAAKRFASTNSRGNSLLMQVWKHDWIHQTKSKCHWEGVACGHLHNVVNLNVTHGHLAGTLPRELVALEHLIVMDLSFNSIGGTLPFEWASAWPSAHIINVSHNLLEGSVPDTWKELWLEKPDVIINLSHNQNLEWSRN